MLFRALQPTAGLEAMRMRRGERPDPDLCSGPGKLTEALGVGLDANEADLGADPFLLLPPEPGWRGEVVSGPRVGIAKAVERPWRFCLAGSRFVSRPRPLISRPLSRRRRRCRPIRVRLPEPERAPLRASAAVRAPAQVRALRVQAPLPVRWGRSFLLRLRGAEASRPLRLACCSAASSSLMPSQAETTLAQISAG